MILWITALLTWLLTAYSLAANQTFDIRILVLGGVGGLLQLLAARRAQNAVQGDQTLAGVRTQSPWQELPPIIGYDLKLAILVMVITWLLVGIPGALALGLALGGSRFRIEVSQSESFRWSLLQTGIGMLAALQGALIYGFPVGLFAGFLFRQPNAGYVVGEFIGLFGGLLTIFERKLTPHVNEIQDRRTANLSLWRAVWRLLGVLLLVLLGRVEACLEESVDKGRRKLFLGPVKRPAEKLGMARPLIGVGLLVASIFYPALHYGPLCTAFGLCIAGQSAIAVLSIIVFGLTFTSGTGSASFLSLSLRNLAAGLVLGLLGGELFSGLAWALAMSLSIPRVPILNSIIEFLSELVILMGLYYGLLTGGLRWLKGVLESPAASQASG